MNFGEHLLSEAPPKIAAHPAERKSKITIAAKVALETFAITVWLYLLCKLLVFDVDNYVIHHYFPKYAWLITYKFFVVIGSLTAWLWLMGLKRGTLLFCLFAAYPLFLLFWRIPAFILRRKSWVLAFAAVNFTIGFFSSFRRNVTIVAVFSISLLTLLITSERSTLAIGAAILTALIIYLYYLTFKSAFFPGRVYGTYSRVIPPISGYLTKNYKLDKTIKDTPLPIWSSDQAKAWADNIQPPLLANRLYLFLARKFRDYQKSPIPFAHSVVIIILLFSATILSFAGINLALFKIDPAAFEASSPSTFSFIWYSFNAFVFNFVKEISPQSAFSQALWMLEAILALFLIAIVVALYLSVRSQKNDTEINGVIETLEREGNGLEAFIREEYQIASIEDAVAELDRLKAGLVTILLWLTSNTR